MNEVGGMGTDHMHAKHLAAGSVRNHFTPSRGLTGRLNYTAERLRFDLGDPCTKPGSPDRCDALAWSGPQNGDVRSNGHIRSR